MNETIIALLLASVSSVAAMLTLFGLYRKANAEPARVKIRIEDDREY